MKRGTSKEPVGKKSSGLGKLMTVLHQNAASLVTTRTAHNGPDQVQLLQVMEPHDTMTVTCDVASRHHPFRRYVGT